MALADRLQSDLTAAMKTRDTDTVATLRMVIAGIKNLRVAEGRSGDVTDADTVQLIDRMLSDGTFNRLDRANEHRRRKLVFVRDDIQTPVNAVDAVDVGDAGRAEHRFVAHGAADPELGDLHGVPDRADISAPEREADVLGADLIAAERWRSHAQHLADGARVVEDRLPTGPDTQQRGSAPILQGRGDDHERRRHDDEEAPHDASSAARRPPSTMRRRRGMRSASAGLWVTTSIVVP